MSFLKKRWHIVCFCIVALTCATVVAVKLDEHDPASFAQLAQDTQRLHQALERRYVGPDYAYGDAAAARLPQAPRAREVWAYAPPHIAYQRPSRPSIDPTTIVKGPERVNLAGELPTLAQLRTHAERGRIRVEFQVPATPNMKAARVAIFRSENANTLDTRVPFASVDLSSAKAVDNWFSFNDTHVEPKRTYFYRLQLAATLFNDRVEKDESGRVIREVRYTPPANAVAQQDAGGQRFFVSVLSPLISDVSPTNFELRFSGTIGQVPLAGAPDALTQDYKGRFVVRIWINELQDWKETALEVRPGERLAGKVLYKLGNGDLKAYAFDTGKVLEEIRRETVSHLAQRRDQVRDENDAPVVDEHNQPRTTETTVTTTPIPVIVAVLKDRETGKSEEMKK